MSRKCDGCEEEFIENDQKGIKVVDYDNNKEYHVCDDICLFFLALKMSQNSFRGERQRFRRILDRI